MKSTTSAFLYIRAHLTAFAMALLMVPSLVHADPVRWQRFADDIEVAQAVFQSTALFSSQVTFIRTSGRRYRPAVIRAAEFGRRAANVSALCALSGAAVCINANFFDADGNPLGVVISKGTMRQKMHRGGKTLTGVFEAGRNHLRILNRSEFDPSQVLEAVQAGPRLITNGKPVEGLHDDGRTKRSGVCIDAQNRLLFFIVPSDFFGASIPDLQTVLLQEGIGCKDALNLDGGGSSQLFLSSALQEVSPEATELFVRGRDDVPVALGLLPVND